MIKRSDVEDALLEGFKDAVKARFAVIAGNALSVSVADAEEQMRNALKNLKMTYELATRIAGELFE